MFHRRSRHPSSNLRDPVTFRHYGSCNGLAEICLQKHVNPEQLVSKYRHVPKHVATTSTPHGSMYSAEKQIPKYLIPNSGISGQAAYRLISDELDFDGKPNLNMASFVRGLRKD